jgi:hypothetical protein
MGVLSRGDIMRVALKMLKALKEEVPAESAT